MKENEPIDRSLRGLIDIIHFVENVSTKVHRLQDEEEIFQAIMSEFSRSGRYKVTFLKLSDDRSFLTPVYTSVSTPIIQAMEKLAGAVFDQYRIDLRKSTVFSQAALEGNTVVANGRDILSEMFPATFVTPLAKVMRGLAKEYSIVTPFRRRGEIVGILTVTAPQLPEYFIPTVRNLSEHIATALDLVDEQMERRRAEYLFTTIATHSQIGTYIAVGGKFEFVNPAFEKELGYKAREIVGKPTLSIVHPDDREYVREQAIRMLEGHDVPGYEFRAVTKDGKIRNVYEKVASVEYQGRRAVLGNYVDITAIKQVEQDLRETMEELEQANEEVQVHAYQLEAANEELKETQAKLLEANEKLRESEQKYRTIFEGANDAMYLLSPDGTVLDGNARSESILGYKLEEVIGRNFADFDILKPNDMNRVIELFNDAMRGGPLQELIELEAIHKDGEPVFIEVGCTLMRKAGQIDTVLVIIRDITERKKSEQHIEHLNVILVAIRKINQLIVREKDPRQLIQSACDILTETREYRIAWAILMNELREPITSAESGIGADFENLIKEIRNDRWPICALRALEHQIMTAVESDPQACVECPLVSYCGKLGTLTIRLEHNNDIYGIFCISGALARAATDEERSLLEEVAGDLAFALYNIELEEQRKRAEEELIAQHEDIRIHSYELEAANDELREAQSRLLELNQQLRESEEKYRTIFESANDLILYLDRSGNVVEVNKRVRDIFGYTPAEVIGKHFSETGIIDSKYWQGLSRQIDDAVGTHGRRGLTELEAIHKNGRSVFIEASISPLERDGYPEGLLAVVRDVTERKQMEERIREYSEELEQRLEELQIAYEKLQELDKMKDNFLSTVSHELRTPLTSIKSFAEILLTYDDTDEATRKEFLSIINEESDRLTRLINDFLDISKIQAGRIQWQTEEVSIPDVIDLAVSATQGISSKAGLTVDINIEPDLPIVWADRDRLVQVVTNLISNAVKFTPPGGNIWIMAEKYIDDDSPGGPEVIKISVADNGVGIAPEDQAEIFEKFIQVGDTLRDKPTGTGLGLAISKEIVEHFGGRIWVVSEPGQGSTFSFTLPILAKSLLEANRQRPEG